MSQIRIAALSTALAMGLAACTGGSDTTTTSSTTSANTVTPTAGMPLPEALPQGLTLDFPYHFTGKEVSNVTANQQRLRYSVEFLEGDVRTVAQSLAESALTAGFQSGQWKLLGDGRIHFFITKTGYGQMRAEIRPADKRKLSHTSAKGTLVMGWPVNSKKAIAK